MAGIRSPQEDAESARFSVATDLISDDERSITADSWSVKSDLGSTWDDEGRTIDTLSIAGTFPTASEYCSDKGEPETELRIRHWGCRVTGIPPIQMSSQVFMSMEMPDKFGSFMFISCPNIVVITPKNTKLNKRFQLVTDKGALDAISLHPIGPANRISYWESVATLVAPGGLLDELIQEAENFRPKLKRAAVSAARGTGPMPPLFRYLDHVISYPTFTFGNLEGSEVATVAFVRRFEI